MHASSWWLQSFAWAGALGYANATAWSGFIGAASARVESFATAIGTQLFGIGPG
jgi:hypothetical protein